MRDHKETEGALRIDTHTSDSSLRTAAEMINAAEEHDDDQDGTTSATSNLFAETVEATKATKERYEEHEISWRQRKDMELAPTLRRTQAPMCLPSGLIAALLLLPAMYAIIVSPGNDI